MIAWLREYLTKDIEKSAGAARPDESTSAPRDAFFAWAGSLGAGVHVLEVGTRQLIDGDATHMRDVFPGVPRGNYTMVDIAEGNDVDVVADIHDLPAEWSNRFDCVVAGAVFEHLERPWVAATEVARVLKPSGRCFIATHQTYPLHAFPADFFRFSKEALSLIFQDAGIAPLEVAYEHRAEIVAPIEMMSKPFARGWNRAWPSYLCVNLFGEKRASNGRALS